MRLRRLRILSFAGLANTELELSPGLNIVVGPNEAGKSTLYHALVHTLLTPARLPKPRFQKSLEAYLPAGGGDTIGAELSFEHAGGSYRLHKRWGATPEAELELADGSRLTDEASIGQALEEMLPVDLGTLEAVFLTGQNGLASTLEELAQHPEALHSLTDLLRRSLLESDKISIGRFRDRLEERIAAALGHWDVERDRPEGGRGWDNPWKRGAGTVLEAFYELQGLEARHGETLAAEKDYEERLGRLETCRERLERLERVLGEEEPIVEDARRRSALGYRLAAEAARLEVLKRDYNQWVESLAARRQLAEEQDSLHPEVQRLEGELAEAQAYARTRALSEAFARARERRAQWESARAALEKAVALPAETMAALRKAAAELQRLQGALSGGALSLTLQARAGLDLSATLDLEGPVGRTLEPGDRWEVRAQGRVRLEHPDWVLEVTSGEEAFEEILRRHEAAQEEFQALLRGGEVTSLEEAEQAHSRYERLTMKAEEARRAFEEALGEESWESLEAAAESLPAGPQKRETAAILEELAKAKARLATLTESARRSADRLATLENSHQSRDALLRILGEQSAVVQGLEQELAALRQLPEGAGDAEAFLTRYRQNEREVQRLREERSGLQSSLEEALRHLPEETAEELAGRIQEARGRFEAELRRARGLLRVRAVADGLLESLEDSGVEELRRRFGEYVRELSGARYAAGPAASLLPEALERRDGTVLRYELLSAGTRDLFALALRLAMAELYLSEGSARTRTPEGGAGSARGASGAAPRGTAEGGGSREGVDPAEGAAPSGGTGFLVMDDPLVDLDPGRQEAAAAVLARFASRRQLLLFTCHPSHAALLQDACARGGAPVSRIELSLG